MITVLCCDDNEIQLESLKKEMINLDIGEKINPFFFSSGREMLAFVEEHGKNVDVILCDIVLEQDNGIVLAGRIKKRFPQIQVIFMSVFAALCEETYEVEHIYFLKKPIKGEKLASAIKKATKHAKKQREFYINIKSSGAIRTICASDILCVESMLREVKIVTEHQSILAYNKIGDMAEQLDDRFLFCHKSYIVNLDKVSKINRLNFTLIDSTQIPISTARYDEVLKSYLHFIGEDI